MSLRFVQITDTHLYADSTQLLYGVNTRQSLVAILAKIKAVVGSIDFLVVTGDLVQDESAAGYQQLHTLLNALEIPVYVIPGNHDDVTVMVKYFSQGRVRWLDQMSMSGWRFIFLNSQSPGKVAGELTEEAYARLSTMLAESSLPTVLFVHHPPLPIASRWLDKIGLQNSERLLELIEKSPSVKAVVNGHIHQEFNYTDSNGVHFYGTPSTCAQFKANSDIFDLDNSLPGWREFYLDDNEKIATKVVRVSVSY